MTAVNEAPPSRLPTAALALSLVSTVLCALCWVGSSIRNAADGVALLAILTLVPLLSLIAIVMGIMALRRPPPGARSWKQGLAGVVIGALNLAACAATFMAMWNYARSFSSH